MSNSPSPDDSKRPDAKAREAEYQALWQVCDRTARKSEYKYADYASRRTILQEAALNLLQRRRDSGKVMCGTSIREMVDRHLKREAHSRIIHEARVAGQLPDIPNTPRHVTSSDLHPMSTPSSGGGGGGPRISLPYSNNTQQMYAANIDPSPLNLRGEIVSLCRQQEAMVADMQHLFARVRSMEHQLAELTHPRVPLSDMDVNLRAAPQYDPALRPRSIPIGENGLHFRPSSHLGENNGLHSLRSTPQLSDSGLHRATPQSGEHDTQTRGASQTHENDILFRSTAYNNLEAGARLRAASLYSQGPSYPEEGIEGSGFSARPQRRPMTPRSQTQGREDADGERLVRSTE